MDNNIIYDIFGNDISDYEQEQNNRIKNNEQKHQNKLLKKEVQEQTKKDFEKQFIIARGYGDLFDGAFSIKDKKRAEEFIQKHKNEIK